MTQNPRKGDCRVLKSKNIPGGSIPRDTPRSLRLRRSCRKSVSIYPGSARGVRMYVLWFGLNFMFFCFGEWYDNEFEIKDNKFETRKTKG